MTVLRDITNDKHREVENLPLIASLLKGTLPKEQYIRYLAELFVIYTKLEFLGDVTGILSQLPGIHRTDKIKSDLEELGYSFDLAPLPSTVKYLQYLDNLVYDPSTRNLLLAHIYVRHMGDLYGGKLIARVVPGQGMSYMFDDRPALIKQFNNMLTVDLGTEANKAFDFFIDIFSELGNELKIN